MQQLRWRGIVEGSALLDVLSGNHLQCSRFLGPRPWVCGTESEGDVDQPSASQPSACHHDSGEGARDRCHSE